MHDLTTTNTPGMPLESNPAASYLASLGSPHSIRAMRTALDQLAFLLSNGEITSCRDYPWHLLTMDHCNWIRSQLKECNVSTANAKLAALRGVLKSCWEKRLIDTDTYERCRRIKSFKNERLAAGRALEREEFRLLIELCLSDESPKGLRDAALLCVGAGSGLRREEIAGLYMADYDPKEGKITVREGKGRKDRITYIANGFKQCLDGWIMARGNEPGPIFCHVTQQGEIVVREITPQAVYDVMVKRARQADVPKFSPHDLRRTFVTEVIDHSGIELAGQLAGHSNYDTTKRYNMGGERKKREAVSKLTF